MLGRGSHPFTVTAGAQTGPMGDALVMTSVPDGIA
jgi:hypothetical protein